MPDWTRSMKQSFEFYKVDPDTWADKERVSTITSCSIDRDDSDSLGSSSFDSTEDLGECFIRVYLVVEQDGIISKHPLGTYILQTSDKSNDSRIDEYSIDAYTPLVILKENSPPLGYSILKNENILENANKLVRDISIAPSVDGSSDKTLYRDFVANLDDDWLSFIKDLLANAKHSLALDELGRILFKPDQEIHAMQPVQEFNDDNSSILYPELSSSYDLYDIPNVIEVICSNGGSGYFYSTAENNDFNSPVSIINRGRRITKRITDVSIPGPLTQEQVDEYAINALKEASTLEYSVSYRHGYCPVNVGDCVIFNHKKAGLIGVKAKVVSQTIHCVPGTPVSEKAIFIKKLWG